MNTQNILTLGSRQHPNGAVETVALKASALTTHAVICGATGSGKTGLIIGAIEELVRQGIPVLAVDVKGDLANLALQPKEMRDKMAVRFLTPGGNHGESVNIFSGIANPDRITSTVTTICKMIGAPADPLQSKPHAFLANIIQWRLKTNKPVTIIDVLNDVVDPPFEYLGMLPLDEMIPKAKRSALAAKLNNLLAAPGFQNWREGVGIDIPKLIAAPPGKTPVVIYSVAHLVDDTERTFAISMFLEEMVSWMRTQPGTHDLRTCLLLDEMYGVMPPHPANPPTKKPLLTLLKQARAHGLGVVICSQNPMDLDYKGMSNAQTWLVGRLQTQNDRARVVNGICAATPADSRQTEATIARLQPRQFLLVRPTGMAVFTSRDCSAELRGPLSPTEITKLFDEGVAEHVLEVDRLALRVEEARASFEANPTDTTWAAVEAAQKAYNEAVSASLSEVAE
ncbi:DUF853 family protein [bacterium]|nr:DUF853 family protein [bacterium]